MTFCCICRFSEFHCECVLVVIGISGGLKEVTGLNPKSRVRNGSENLPSSSLQWRKFLSKALISAAAPVSNRPSASSWFGTVPRPCAGPQQTDSGDFNTYRLCVSQTVKEKEEEKEDSFTEKEIQEAQPRTASDTAEKLAQSGQKLDRHVQFYTLSVTAFITQTLHPTTITEAKTG